MHRIGRGEGGNYNRTASAQPLRGCKSVRKCTAGGCYQFVSKAQNKPAQNSEEHLGPSNPKQGTWHQKEEGRQSHGRIKRELETKLVRGDIVLTGIQMNSDGRLFCISASYCRFLNLDHGGKRLQVRKHFIYTVTSYPYIFDHAFHC